MEDCALCGNLLTGLEYITLLIYKQEGAKTVKLCEFCVAAVRNTNKSLTKDYEPTKQS